MKKYIMFAVACLIATLPACCRCKKEGCPLQKEKQEKRECKSCSMKCKEEKCPEHYCPSCVIK